MTIIVYRDGVMAADTATFVGDILVSDRAQKIVRISDGTLIGCAGEVVDIHQFREWAEGGFQPGSKPKGFKDFGAIVVNQSGSVFRYDEKCNAYPTDAFYTVEGSNHDFAFGALAAGASAEEVERLVIKHCPYVGGHVQTMRLEMREPLRPSTQNNDFDQIWEKCHAEGGQ